MKNLVKSLFLVSSIILSSMDYASGMEKISDEAFDSDDSESALATGLSNVVCHDVKSTLILQFLGDFEVCHHLSNINQEYRKAIYFWSKKLPIKKVISDEELSPSNFRILLSKLASTQFFLSLEFHNTGFGMRADLPIVQIFEVLSKPKGIRKTVVNSKKLADEIDRRNGGLYIIMDFFRKTWDEHESNVSFNSRENTLSLFTPDQMEEPAVFFKTSDGPLKLIAMTDLILQSQRLLGSVEFSNF